jgi:hypothetical protein
MDSISVDLIAKNQEGLAMILLAKLEVRGELSRNQIQAEHFVEQVLKPLQVRFHTQY